MRHDLFLEGPACRLRPVVRTDAGFILQLRSDSERTQFLHPVSGRLEDQEAWLEAYETRPGDWYWIVERRSNGAPEGTLGLYDFKPAPSEAEWGRWILRAGSPFALESAWLLYRLAFEEFGLAAVYCRTLALNAQVLSFHDSCGLDRAGLIPRAFHIGEAWVDAVEHRLTRAAWPEVRARLEPKIQRLARTLNGG